MDCYGDFKEESDGFKWFSKAGKYYEINNRSLETEYFSSYEKPCDIAIIIVNLSEDDPHIE